MVKTYEKTYLTIDKNFLARYKHSDSYRFLDEIMFRVMYYSLPLLRFIGLTKIAEKHHKKNLFNKTK